MDLSPILDLHNGYLVSYTISDRTVLGMVTSMLEKAFVTIPDGTGLILNGSISTRHTSGCSGRRASDRV